MSTKATLSYSEDYHYHLYEECFDNSLVYLRLDNPVSLQADMWEASESNVTVAIPIETWRHIVEGWLKTQREQDPDRDHDELMSNKITQNNTSEQDNDHYTEYDES